MPGLFFSLSHAEEWVHNKAKLLAVNEKFPIAKLWTLFFNKLIKRHMHTMRQAMKQEDYRRYCIYVSMPK